MGSALGKLSKTTWRNFPSKGVVERGDEILRIGLRDLVGSTEFQLYVTFLLNPKY